MSDATDARMSDGSDTSMSHAAMRASDAIDARVNAARIVLWGVGSPLVADVEESCARAGVAIAAGVRNVDAPVATTAAVRVIGPDALTDDERALPFLVPLFTPGHRARAAAEAARHGMTHTARVVDPTAIIARSVFVDVGCYVNAGVVIVAATTIGIHALVNRSASIGHHARIGDFAAIGPGAVLCGLVTLGRGAVVGAGAVVLPSVVVGDNAVVAAGSVVRDAVAARTMVAGNPARVVATGIDGYNGVGV